MAGPLVSNIIQGASIVNPDMFGPMAKLLQNQEQMALQREQLALQQQNARQTADYRNATLDLSERQFGYQQQQGAMQNEIAAAQMLTQLAGDETALRQAVIGNVLDYQQAVYGHSVTSANARGRLQFDWAKLASDETTDEERRIQAFDRQFSNPAMARLYRAKQFGVDPAMLLYDESIPLEERQLMARMMGEAAAGIEFQDGNRIIRDAPTEINRNMQVLQRAERGLPFTMEPSEQERMLATLTPETDTDYGKGLTSTGKIVPGPGDVGMVWPDRANVMRDKGVVHINVDSADPNGIALANGEWMLLPPTTAMRADRAPLWAEWKAELGPNRFRLGQGLTAPFEDYDVERKPYRPTETINGVTIQGKETIVDTESGAWDKYATARSNIASLRENAATLFHFSNSYGLTDMTEAKAQAQSAWTGLISAWRKIVEAGALDAGTVELFGRTIDAQMAEDIFEDVWRKIKVAMAGGDEQAVKYYRQQLAGFVANIEQDYSEFSSAVLRGHERDKFLAGQNLSPFAAIANDTAGAHELLTLLSENTRIYNKLVDDEADADVLPGGRDQGPEPIELTPEQGQFVQQVARDVMAGPDLRDTLIGLRKADVPNEVIVKEVSETVDDLYRFAPEMFEDEAQLRGALTLLLQQELEDITNADLR